MLLPKLLPQPTAGLLGASHCCLLPLNVPPCPPLSRLASANPVPKSFVPLSFTTPFGAMRRNAQPGLPGPTASNVQPTRFKLQPTAHSLVRKLAKTPCRLLVRSDQDPLDADATRTNHVGLIGR